MKYRICTSYSERQLRISPLLLSFPAFCPARLPGPLCCAQALWCSYFLISHLSQSAAWVHDDLFQRGCLTSGPKHQPPQLPPSPLSIHLPTLWHLSCAYFVPGTVQSIYVVGIWPRSWNQGATAAYFRTQQCQHLPSSLSTIKCASSCPYSLLLRVLRHFLTGLLPYLSLV